MTPIISPWIFYFAQVGTTMKIILILSLSITIIITASYYIKIYDCMNCTDPTCQKQEKLLKRGKRMIITTIIITTLIIATPTEDTIYKMTAAKFATKQNIETVYDKIIDSAAKLGEAWNQKEGDE